MVMFRSVLIPVKAAVMNLLSVTASYGVLTAVFQWGWGQELLGLDHAVPVSSWLPILMFAILFGLSMDYEVFLLSRIREDYERTGDAHGSVARGLASTSRVITTAAAIMVLVFLGFATEEGVVIKMIGFGMAVAIFLDATLVRMVLVPATMSLLGERNWWLPAWLDRILPNVQVEAPEPEVADPVERSVRPSWSADAQRQVVCSVLLGQPVGHTTMSALPRLPRRDRRTGDLGRPGAVPLVPRRDPRTAFTLVESPPGRSDRPSRRAQPNRRLAPWERVRATPALGEPKVVTHATSSRRCRVRGVRPGLVATARTGGVRPDGQLARGRGPAAVGARAHLRALVEGRP